MSDDETSQLRKKAVQECAGEKVNAVESPEELIGRWEMRFGGPLGTEALQWYYEFHRDGNVKVQDETWTWTLGKHGMLNLLMTSPPDPTTPGLEEGAVTEEVRYAFRADDGRVILCNEDTSVIEMLTRLHS